MQKPTTACITLIKKWEGLHKRRQDGLIESYLDPVGIWTIGYGSIHHRDLNRPVQPGDRITEAAAERWLNDEIAETAEDVGRLCQSTPLTNGMFDALVSFVYNIGVGAFGESTLLRKLKARDYKGASREFDRWVNGSDNGIPKPLQGLVNRRNEEEELFIRDGFNPSTNSDGNTQVRGELNGAVHGNDGMEEEVSPYKPAKTPLALRELLLQGDMGEDCYVLNCALAGLGFLRMGPQVNTFTKLTADAVMLFQQREYLSKVDAKVGPETKRALENSLIRARDPVPSHEPSGETFARLTKTNKKNSDGLFWCNLEFVTSSGVADSMKVYSGIPSTQDDFLLYTDPASKPESNHPIPQNRYTIGDIEFAGGRDNYTVSFPHVNDGLGPVWVPLTARMPDDRGAFGFHLDNNRSTSPGSAGCICPDSMANLKVLVTLLRKHNPRLLVVDWGL